MSTYTTSLGLEEITPGDQAGLWGNTTNNNLALIDQAIAGVTPVYLDTKSGFTYVLTNYNGAFDESRAAVINVTYSSSPATGANIIQIPSAQKLYVFRNSSGQSITVQTVAAAYTVTLANGEATLVFCDGTNAFPGIATAGVGTLTVPYGGTGVTSFGGSAGFVYTPGGTSALGVVTTVNLSSQVSNTLPVTNGGTGQTSFTSGSLIVGNGTGGLATLSGGASGQVATWNGSTWTAATPAVGAVTSVFGRTSAVTAQSTDYSAYYYPLSSNPSGYLTSSSLTNYASLTTSSQQTFAGGIRASGFGTYPYDAGYYNARSGLTANAFTVEGTGVAANTGIYLDIAATAWVMTLGSGNKNIFLNNSQLSPGSDNNVNLGGSTVRWANIYCANGTIITSSDRNGKTEIAGLDEAEKRVATRIKGLIKKFKFKDAVAEKGSDGARIHVGVIAQEVGDAFTAEGLDPHKYALFCYDEWEDKPASVNSDGVVMQEAVKAGSRYSIRYEELLAFVIAAL